MNVCSVFSGACLCLRACVWLVSLMSWLSSCLQPLEVLRPGMQREFIVAEEEDEYGEVVLSLAAIEVSSALRYATGSCCFCFCCLLLLTLLLSTMRGHCICIMLKPTAHHAPKHTAVCSPQQLARVLSRDHAVELCFSSIGETLCCMHGPGCWNRFFTCFAKFVVAGSNLLA